MLCLDKDGLQQTGTFLRPEHTLSGHRDMALQTGTVPVKPGRMAILDGYQA